MAIPSDFLKRQYAYFHANSKLLKREGHDYLYNSDIRAGHIVKTNEIIAEEVPFYTFLQKNDLDAWIINNPGIIKKYDKYPLTSLGGTSDEIWYIEDDIGNGTQWMRPMILPELITNLQNQPASGYMPQLWKEDGVTQIYPNNGVWWVDPYQGCLKFGDTYNPGDTYHVGEAGDDTSDWGNPKITCYIYIGGTLDQYLQTLKPITYKYYSSFPSVSHSVIHNLNTKDVLVNVQVQDPVSGIWNNELVGVQYIDDNSLNLFLTESCNVKAYLQVVPDPI